MGKLKFHTIDENIMHKEGKQEECQSLSIHGTEMKEVIVDTYLEDI